MEEENKSEQTQNKNGVGKIVIIVVAALIVVAIIAGIVMLRPKKAIAPESSVPHPSGLMNETPTASPSQALKGKTINVTGTNFSFDPASITVKKGDTVTINFTSGESVHDFVLSDFNVKSSRVTAGNSTSITFTADKVGTFEYFCSVGNHRDAGMVGKLIVQ